MYDYIQACIMTTNLRRISTTTAQNGSKFITDSAFEEEKYLNLTFGLNRARSVFCLCIFFVDVTTN